MCVNVFASERHRQSVTKHCHLIQPGSSSSDVISASSSSSDRVPALFIYLCSRYTEKGVSKSLILVRVKQSSINAYSRNVTVMLIQTLLLPCPYLSKCFLENPSHLSATQKL